MITSQISDETDEPFSSLLATVSDERYASLVGKFHAHMTFQLREDQHDACRLWCRNHKVKLTVIDLANASGQTQTDVMSTVHFRDDQPDAVLRMAQRLIELSVLAVEDGFPVTRLKLEHESLPTISDFDREHYHEVHVKLQIPAEQYSADYEKLVELGSQYGFVPSKNPFQRKQDSVTQFANLRIYDGSLSDADATVVAVENVLRDNGFSIQEVKRETVVYDTAHFQDSWWA